MIEWLTISGSSLQSLCTQKGFAQWSVGKSSDKSILSRNQKCIQRASDLLKKLPAEAKKVKRVAEPYSLFRGMAFTVLFAHVSATFAKEVDTKSMTDFLLV